VTHLWEGKTPRGLMARRERGGARRAPKPNAIAERMVGTFRRECLDHTIVVSEPHLYALLAAFVAYDNRQRPHRMLVLEPPLPLARAPTGRIRSRPVLGGLHHVYERAA
jgi:transposase InsO family protein